MGHNARAFTLVELLVVVAIIGLLVSMLTPSFVTVSDLARETTCKSNLLLLSKAAFAYMQANNDFLPKNDWKAVNYGNFDANELLLGEDSTPKWWCNKVFKYGVPRPEIYICPSDPMRGGDSEPVRCGYGFNNTLTNPTGGAPGSAGAPGDGAETLFEIKDSERTALIGHCTDLTREPAILEEMVTPDYWPRGHMKAYDYTAKATLGRVGFVMANGQVETKTYAEAQQIKNKLGKLVLFRKD